jgi:polysaccharide export outer membrane protein
MMSRAVFSVVLAIMPVLGLGAEDPKSPPAPQTQQPPTQSNATPDSPPGAGTVTPPPPAAAPPVIPPAAATDPTKIAEPKPAPDAKVPGAVQVDERTYIIGPEDDLQISVWEQPALGCACVVRSDGMITVPLINEVKAAGLTLLELRQVITEALGARALNDPQVTVSLMGAHSKKYYLYGQVKTPGVHDLTTATTVLQAIVSAGGFADFANQKDITIVRGDKRLKFNFKEVMAGKNLKQNIYLEPGDIIYVK